MTRGIGRGVSGLTGILRRIPWPVQVVLVLAWVGADF